MSRQWNRSFCVERVLLPYYCTMIEDFGEARPFRMRDACSRVGVDFGSIRPKCTSSLRETGAICNTETLLLNINGGTTISRCRCTADVNTLWELTPRFISWAERRRLNGGARW